MSETMMTLAIKVAVFIEMSPKLVGAIKIASGVLAGFSVYAIATDPEAANVFMATAAGNPTGGVLAADFIALRNLGTSFANSSRNIMHLRYNTGSIRDFWRKTTKLKNSAQQGGLIFAKNTDDIREPRLQRAYRKAVKDRLSQLYQSQGKTKDEAAALVDEFMSTRQVDHKIDLQVSGALDNPNARSNLTMLDASVNGSIGKQIDLEAARLGLKEGDTIHDIIIHGPQP